MRERECWTFDSRYVNIDCWQSRLSAITYRWMLNVHSAMSAHNAASRSSVENTRHDNPPCNVSAHVDRALVRFICIVDTGPRFCVYPALRTRYVKFLDRKCWLFKIFNSCHCQKPISLDWCIFRTLIREKSFSIPIESTCESIRTLICGLTN